jgi:hypothetical protein
MWFGVDADAGVDARKTGQPRSLNSTGCLAGGGSSNRRITRIVSSAERRSPRILRTSASTDWSMTCLTSVVEPVEAADGLVTASVAAQYTRLSGAWMNTIAGDVVAHQLGSCAARPISRMCENLTCRARELVRAVRELAHRRSPLLLLRSVSVDDFTHFYPV